MRVYNFSAGPAVLPEEVLKEAADEMLDYKGTGMSVMEMSHRSKAYDEIIKDAEKDLRDLMNIPDNYKVLFLQGGASTQFAAVPLNLIGRTGKADYIVTGSFSGKAAKEAGYFANEPERPPVNRATQNRQHYLPRKLEIKNISESLGDILMRGFSDGFLLACCG